MGPNNAIIGDSTGVELPVAAVDDTAKKELQNKAKYKRSKEYAELKAKADARIEFYSKNLPVGYAEANTAKKAELWGMANLLIAEFKALFEENEQAEEILKDMYGE